MGEYVNLYLSLAAILLFFGALLAFLWLAGGFRAPKDASKDSKN
jgi:hypothetical protein